jgi:ElaB/YqjD/DUF883 family membrane-anchored ribosome-binding protein
VSDAPTSSNPPSDDPATIEAEIEATRARLSGTVDELAVRIHPKTIVQRTQDDVKLRIQVATDEAKARLKLAADEAKVQLHDAVYASDGTPRTERLAAVGAALAALIGLVVWRRVRRH